MNNPEKDFSANKLTLNYFGRSDDRITSLFIGISEKILGDDTNLEKMTRRSSVLIAECFQNIVRHGNDSEAAIDIASEKDFFQIRVLADRIMICSKNLIEKKHVESLNKSIDHVNQLSEEELKQVWIKTLKDGKLSSKGGAGLGIIEMARKTNLPLRKKFDDVDENFSRFFFGIEYAKQGEKVNSLLDMDQVIEQYNDSITKGVLLSYSGNFSGGTNSALIQMLHNNLILDSDEFSKSVENLMTIIEVVQNVSKHGALVNEKKGGVLTIFNEEGTRFIECQNYLKMEEYNRFSTLLQHIKSRTVAQLKEEMKKRMVNDEITQDGNSGLGLIEIALFTKNEFEYSLEKMSDQYYRFAIRLKLKNHG